MTDQNFKRVSDDSGLCAVLTENDPCVRYCVPLHLCMRRFISKLCNPYIWDFLTFGIILNLKFTHMILIFMRANDVCFETPMMTASDDCDMVMTSIYSL